MERSQAVQNLANHLIDIETHFREEYPKEGCGLLGIKTGQLHWLPCTNHATTNTDFQMDSVQYLKYSMEYTIVGIVHSHPDLDSTPSETDIKVCNAVSIPYYIFGYPDMDLTVLTPEHDNTELYGRSYEFGVTDCFEAMRDYLKSVNIELKPRILFEANWWEKDEKIDYFSPEVIKNWGGIEVPLNEAQENDVFIFSVYSDVANHCAVYLGNDIIFHHAENRLSTKENLYPYWAKFLTGVYRYET